MFVILTIRSGQDTDGTKSLTEELPKSGTIYRVGGRFRESVMAGEITKDINSPTLELWARGGRDGGNERTALSLWESLSSGLCLPLPSQPEVEGVFRWHSPGAQTPGPQNVDPKEETNQE